MVDDGKKAANKKLLTTTGNMATLGEAIKSAQVGIANMSVSDDNKEEWMSGRSVLLGSLHPR